jgi:hypothetical protein
MKRSRVFVWTASLAMILSCALVISQAQQNRQAVAIDTDDIGELSRGRMDPRRASG